MRSDISEIRRAAQRAASLTRQLLAFSRRQVLQPTVLDPNAAITDMQAMLTRVIGEDVELVTHLDANTGSIKVDPGQLEQILLNLSVNARDAMPQGGSLTIRTKRFDLDAPAARREVMIPAGSWVAIEVADSGTGMDATTLSHIFEPFFTTKPVGKGTGLGLSTVYGITQQSGGHVWVESTVGRGTVFTICFPRVDRNPPAPESGVNAQTSVGRETILLVEDEDSVRALARRILQRKGYTVLEASNGGEALLLCERTPNKIHLLLTDVIMPQMSGRAVAERLRLLRPEMRVLYVSGYTDDEIVHRGLLDHGVTLLEKPFTPDALARKVREVLDA
jgi:CheY-like chemotaxis protein